MDRLAYSLLLGLALGICFSLGAYIGFNYKQCDRVIDLFCTIFHDGSMACNAVDETGNFTWLLKLPCEANATTFVICKYSLENKTYFNCTDVTELITV